MRDCPVVRGHPSSTVTSRETRRRLGAQSRLARAVEMKQPVAPRSMKVETLQLRVTGNFRAKIQGDSSVLPDWTKRKTRVIFSATVPAQIISLAVELSGWEGSTGYIHQLFL